MADQSVGVYQTGGEVRSRIPDARLIVIKCGTSVVAENGHIALGRIGSIVEQIHRLREQGKLVMLVSSGSVGIGRRKLKHQQMMDSSLRSHVSQIGLNGKQFDDRACAAAGQSELMALYDMMFNQFDLATSQVLVTDADFTVPARRQNLRRTLLSLLALGVVPVLNENDVVSERVTPLRDLSNKIFWDNDSLAALVAAELNEDVLILLSDVEGLYSHMPAEGVAPEVVTTFRPQVRLY